MSPQCTGGKCHFKLRKKKKSDFSSSFIQELASGQSKCYRVCACKSVSVKIGVDAERKAWMAAEGWRSWAPLLRDQGAPG